MDTKHCKLLMRSKIQFRDKFAVVDLVGHKANCADSVKTGQGIDG